jgi:hypothetical protein
VGKVPVESAWTDLRNLGNFIHTRGLNAPLGKELSSHGENTLAVLGGVAPLAPLHRLCLTRYVIHHLSFFFLLMHRFSFVFPLTSGDVSVIIFLYGDISV